RARPSRAAARDRPTRGRPDRRRFWGRAVRGSLITSRRLWLRHNAGVHRFAHLLSIVLITAGLVVLSDAGATLLWQEPMSAAYGALKQAQAEEDLAKLKEEFPTAADLAQLEGVEGSAARASILAG